MAGDAILEGAAIAHQAFMADVVKEGNYSRIQFAASDNWNYPYVHI